MTEIVLGTVHPVTGNVEVGDVLGLCARAVIEDDSDRIFGDIAAELGLAVLVCYGFCLRRTGPFAVDRAAVSVPAGASLDPDLEGKPSPILFFFFRSSSYCHLIAIQIMT